jgi:hypothetical protein
METNMSDCFDHAADAYDDLCFGRTSDEGTRGDPYRSSKSDYNGGPARYKTCKYCGATGLRWKQIEGLWKLCVGGIPHQCKPKYTTGNMIDLRKADATSEEHRMIIYRGRAYIDINNPAHKIEIVSAHKQGLPITVYNYYFDCNWIPFDHYFVSCTYIDLYPLLYQLTHPSESSHRLNN